MSLGLIFIENIRFSNMYKQYLEGYIQGCNKEQFHRERKLIPCPSSQFKIELRNYYVAWSSFCVRKIQKQDKELTMVRYSSLSHSETI